MDHEVLKIRKKMDQLIKTKKKYRTLKMMMMMMNYSHITLMIFIRLTMEFMLISLHVVSVA